MTRGSIETLVATLELSGKARCRCACGRILDTLVSLRGADAYNVIDVREDIKEEALMIAEGNGWRSRNGGIVCPDCASKLETETNGG